MQALARSAFNRTDPVTDPDPVAVTACAEPAAAADGYREICDAWMGATGTSLPPVAAERLDGYAERLGLEWVLDAIRETGELGKRAPRYTFVILDRWASEGRSREAKQGLSPGHEQPVTDIKAALALAGARSPMREYAGVWDGADDE